LIVLPPLTEELIDRAFAEDVGDGDHTTLSTIPASANGAAQLLVKDTGILAGVELALAIIERYDPQLIPKVFLEDGAQVKPSDVVMIIHGPVRSILVVERLLLNFMQRMSGIATLTNRFVSAIEGTGCRVLDTRKTTPGLREIEKWAVRIGGGTNHRMGLYDMMMIKDNHVDFAGGIPQAIAAARTYQKDRDLKLPIEIETRNISEVQQVLETGGIQRIMLDNFTPKNMREAVSLINDTYETEASGGIMLTTARAYAETGVNFISVGALTHSFACLDLSLKAL